MGVFRQLNQRYAGNGSLFPDSGKEVIFFRPRSVNKQCLWVHVVVDMVCSSVSSLG